MEQAEQPRTPNTDCYENMPGGTATAKAVILTALPVEHTAVEAHLQPLGSATRLTEDIHPETKTIYTKGQFKTDTCIWNVAVAQISMGNENAALEAERAISYLKPDVILFVGVAGGIKDVEIGDVVAASIVYRYESGKVLADRTLPRPKLGEADYDLKQRASAESRKELWQKRILPGLGKSEKAPKSYVKPIAAGEKVIASRKTKIYEYLREYYDDALAVEMEGAGFLTATQQVKTVSAMVIRGISDLIDGKNDNSEESEDIRQDRASRHASAFAFEVLANFYGQTDSEETEEEAKSFELNTGKTTETNQPCIFFEAVEENQYYLQAFHAHNQPLRTKGSIEPMLTQITKLIESEQDPAIILDEIDECHEKLEENENCLIRKFLRWLADQSLTDESACLLIDDCTKLNIPWELLEVDEIPLGAKLQTIHHRNVVKKRKITSLNSCFQGRLLAYTTNQNYRWQTLFDCQRHSDFYNFLDDLQRSSSDYDMVFIDGFSVQEPLSVRPRSFIRRSYLLKQGASVVFMNGHLNFDESVELSHSDLLNLFLKHGARGVIATFGAFKFNISEDVIEKFFKLLNQSNQESSVTIPIILRQMRQQAYESLLDNVSKNRASYLATLLYVYYEDIQTDLQLMSDSS
ncbi:5'-methylthioadenosine/S-adenosylhomocysteine nucleosidase family protein [Leptothoe spongobia]|uniref:5'-methylthioadenosine/S-adenosylhomocysteine nucleosidase n=1 Tax=Leptothoe spongobia TAU-MAC 1115 TaxID=1967444 RepID=A0A947DGQ3_9CYAN|nr:5'-methylthioadenosine/S-adenosylhomocysteine nucleosidase [Leptothoe spongobia]MBT9316440.1 5'-methylthioadenosine/S-adenosylhomocysteine nucleosidase [Leptothoe spongobia TAU-MAC 1115]